MLKKDESASTKVCNLIEELIDSDKFDITILPLVNYDLKACHLCGDCSLSQRCSYDKNFNKIYEKIIESDYIFFVVPHYSPIPSKLLIVFEKINEILYSAYLKNSEFLSPNKETRVGVIGHGGMVENEKTLKYYHDQLVTPISNVLRSLSFNVIGVNDDFPNGSVFGLNNGNCLVMNDEKVFPDIIQDYDMIKTRIEPLIYNVLNIKI